MSVCVRERERERGGGGGGGGENVSYNEAAGKNFVTTGTIDRTNSRHNKSLLNVPSD